MGAPRRRDVLRRDSIPRAAIARSSASSSGARNTYRSAERVPPDDECRRGDLANVAVGFDDRRIDAMFSGEDDTPTLVVLVRASCFAASSNEANSTSISGGTPIR